MNRQVKHTWTLEVTEPVAVQSQDGTTARAVALARAHVEQLGQAQYVECIMPYGDKYADSLVRLIDRNGNYIELDGVSWGYSGAGPHGLSEVFKMFQIPIGLDRIAHWGQEHLVIHVSGISALQPACTQHCPASAQGD